MDPQEAFYHYHVLSPLITCLGFILCTIVHRIEECVSEDRTRQSVHTLVKENLHALRLGEIRRRTDSGEDSCKVRHGGIPDVL